MTKTDPMTKPESSTEDVAVRLNDATVVIHKLYEAVYHLKPTQADLRLADQALAAARTWMDGEQP